jgi:hypothetical protein
MIHQFRTWEGQWRQSQITSKNEIPKGRFHTDNNQGFRVFFKE